MMEGEVLVAHPQTVQEGSVEVVDMDLVFPREVTELVGGTVNDARSYSPPASHMVKPCGWWSRPAPSPRP